MLAGIEKIAAGLQAVQAEAVAEGVSTPQQRTLLAQLEMFGVAAPSKPMIAAHARVSPTSGGYFNNLGKLRSITRQPLTSCQCGK